MGEDRVDGFDRLACTLQEDGSCYMVERPLDRGLKEEGVLREEGQGDPRWSGAVGSAARD